MLLATDWLALAACVMLGAGLAAAMHGRRRWPRALAYALAGLIWLVHIAHSLLEYPWVRLVPHTASTVLMYVAVWPPLIAMLFGMAPLLPQARDRRVLKLVSLAIGLYGVYTIVMTLLTPPVSTASYWSGEVLMQTTDSTCIAASAVTYLHAHGIKLDELHAARQGLIGREGGRLAQAWRILRLNVPPDWRVRIAPAGPGDFADGQWRIVSERLLLNVGHAVAVRQQPDGTMLVRDPANGEYTQSWAEFARDYLGTAVWAEPPGAAH